MDEIDVKLLDALQSEGRIAVADLAQRVGLSGPAVADRIRKLERQGAVLGYHARLAPRALGLGLLAFVGVTIDRPRNNQSFLELAADCQEVLECHHVAGEDSYLLKVICRDTAHLEAVLARLKQSEGVVRTRTTIVLSTVHEANRLPLGTSAHER